MTMRRFLLILLVMVALPASAGAEMQSFAFTGAEQTFTVPARVSSVHVVAVGARGGGADFASAGPGQMATADLAVTPGALLFVEVGGPGGIPGGGFNGGGDGSSSGLPGALPGGGGGGASDVRILNRTDGQSPSSRRVVAAGGGGTILGVPGAAGGGPGAGGGNPNGTGTNGSGGGGGGGGGFVGGTGAPNPGAGTGGTGHFGDGTSNGSLGTAAVIDDPSVVFTWTPKVDTPPPTTSPTPTPTPTPTPMTKAKKPQTKLGRHPDRRLRLKRGHKRVRVRFRFSSPAKTATFRCKLDDRKEKACDSGIRYRVGRGFHSFRVVAVLDGVRDPSPSRFAFTVRKPERRGPSR